MSLLDTITAALLPPFIIQPPSTDLHYPVLLSSPHSGMYYDDRQLAKCRLSLQELRKSEDSYVHLLLEQTPRLGVTFLQATLPRIFCDLNREAWELDPELFTEPLPTWCHIESPQIKKGIGTIHKISALRKHIYKYYLSFAAIKSRIETYWFSYHQQISNFITKAQEDFGGCIILDMHSMPSMPKRSPYYHDIVLGDGFSQSCAPVLINNTQKYFIEKGMKVSKNIPYSGGFITKNYGNPSQNIHVMQIEINKSLYMNEENFEIHDGFKHLQHQLNEYIQWMTTQVPYILS